MREFKAFIEDLELTDLPALGKKFTYFSSDGVTMSRIDRFLVSEGFIARWSLTSQWVGDRDISDHCMLWLISSRVNWGPKPFRFNNCWIEHKDFANLVKEVWGSPVVEGKKYFVLKEKMKKVKEKLKKWNKEVFGFRDLRIENIVKDLNVVETLAAEGGPPEVDQRRVLNADFWRELRIKESLLAQKSRLKWLAEGDENSRFFHACIRSNRRRTNIVKLQVGEGWVENVNDIKGVIKDHFEEFFKEEVFNRPTLDGVDFGSVGREDNELLTRPFTVEEIKEAIWDCDGNKCPGPDGFNFNFLKSCWNVVEPEVVSFFEEFHSKGVIPKAVSASFLTLVPKVTNPQQLGEYRPISLIGSMYKMLAKVLAGRLKKVVPKVISETQNAFIAGRNILDGVVVVNEVVDMAKRSQKKCLILKVDFQKAYDTVNWKYLDYMMSRMGFNAKWRKWMNACVSSNSISVLVNGSPTDEFVAQKGIKQGDPLAPFLFLIAAEGLTGLTKKAEVAGGLSGFKVSENLSISLLQFADDTLFLCDGSESSVWCLKAILRSFELVSGLKINFTKSNVIGINVDPVVLNGISSFMSCKVGELPFKFLGVPIGGNPRRESMWREVIESVRARLSQWRSLKLSMGGRLSLINSVLASLPLYLFSMFKAPKKVLRELEKIQRNFLWGGNEEQKKISWVKWSQVCKPKCEGGLGVKNLYLFNLALLAKWRWRLLDGTHTTLWKSVLVERYGYDRPWFGQPLTSSATRNSSLWWRDLALLGKDSSIGSDWFKEVVKKRIGNGSSVKFWLDTWIGTEPLAVLFPTVMAAHGVPDATVADMGVWTVLGWKWKWCISGLHTVFVADMDASVEGVLTDFVEFFQGVQLQANEQDAWVWTVDKPRGFTVKSCYSWLNNRVLVTDVSNEESVISACKSLWKSDIPSKVLVFCWRLLLRKLPTRENLFIRKIIPSIQDAKCVFCRSETESIDHLFCCCTVVKDVWRGVFGWLNVQANLHEEVLQVHDGVRALVKGKGAKRIKSIFWAATVYQIWMERNSIIFNNKVTSARSIVTSIKYVSWGWFIARRGRNSGLSFSDWFCSPIGCISTL